MFTHHYMPNGTAANPAGVVSTPTTEKYLFPSNVSNEQDQYVQGFLDALKTVYAERNFQPLPLQSPSLIYETLASATKRSPTSLSTTTMSEFDALVRTLQLSAKEGLTPHPQPMNGHKQALLAATVKAEKNGSIPSLTDVFGSSASSNSVHTNGASQHSVDAMRFIKMMESSGIGQSAPGSSTATAPAATATAPALPPPVKPESRTSDASDNDEPDSDESDDESERSGSTRPTSRSTTTPASTRKRKSNLKKDLAGMDDQEVRKLERKRQRNREAASKCRQKKLARINELENLVQLEKEKAQRLDSDIGLLKQKLIIAEQYYEAHQKACETNPRR